MRKKGFWLGAWVLALLLPFSQALIAHPVVTGDAQPFSHDWLKSHAQALSTRAFEPVRLAPNNFLRSLTYDDYRRIVFDSDAAIWKPQALPFQLQLFHPGFLHTTPVGIHLVSDGMARQLAFSTALFNYNDSPVNRRRVNAPGYAGFRVHYPINTAERHEEFLVFLGASYFRAVGKDQFYGISARGLAVNTIGEGGEEFPLFTQVWIEQPEAGATEVVVHALLDSPSVTGAYRFTAVPGTTTRMDVEASLYPRRDRERVGIAPLTSMFQFDATNRAIHDDYRNAVHDSNGLQILQADGEQIWRPLANPARLQVSAFGANQAMPAGFGLLQRRNTFSQFNDHEARYDKRPSLWIEPQGDWGEGHVELVEIPTLVEYHDNIVAYWQPQGGFKAGQEYTYKYRMDWGVDSPRALDQGRVVDTSSGKALGSEERLFVIDYSEGQHIANSDAVRIRATTSAGEITDVSGTLVESTGHYRAYVKLNPGQATQAELRVTLEVEGQPWGETWLYRWTP